MSSTQARIIGPISHGSATTARAGARQIGSSTPASIALASAGGIRATQRASARESRAITISAPANANAPSAAG